MSIAHYMRFEPAGASAGLDRTGGLPTHLPREWPRCPATGERMAFLAQSAELY